MLFCILIRTLKSYLKNFFLKLRCAVNGSLKINSLLLRKVSDFSIECNGHTIKAQRSVKYLGLNLDDQLSGEAIVNSIVQKVNGSLKFLYRQCSFLEENIGNQYARHLFNATWIMHAHLGTPV